MFSLIKRAAKKRIAIQCGNRLEFHVFWPMKALIIVTVAINGLFTFFTAYVAVTDHEAPFWLPLVFLAMGGAAALGAPALVTIDSVGVRQNCWWRTKQIAWKEVVEAVHEPKTDRTIVRGKSGACISFSPYLVAQPQFEQQLLKRCNLDEIPEYI